MLLLSQKDPPGYSSPTDPLRSGGAKKKQAEKRGWLYTTFSDYGVRACRVTPANRRKGKKKEGKKPWDPIPKP